MAYHLTTETLLKAVDAPKVVVGQCFKVDRNVVHRGAIAAAMGKPHGHLTNLVGNAPKVIASGALLARPANSSPLQRMIGHAAALLTAACPPYVPGHGTTAEHNQGTECFALKFGY